MKDVEERVKQNQVHDIIVAAVAIGVLVICFAVCLAAVCSLVGGV